MTEITDQEILFLMLIPMIIVALYPWVDAIVNR